MFSGANSFNQNLNRWEILPSSDTGDFCKNAVCAGPKTSKPSTSMQPSNSPSNSPSIEPSSSSKPSSKSSASLTTVGAKGYIQMAMSLYCLLTVF